MNAARGEIQLTLDGQDYPLCLTLGALAEMEQAFGCASLADLQSRLTRLSAKELAEVLEILLRSAGANCPVEKVSPGQAARAVAEAFRAALG